MDRYGDRIGNFGGIDTDIDQRPGRFDVRCRIVSQRQGFLECRQSVTRIIVRLS